MKRILVIRLSAMGDVAMCQPILTTLLQQYPYLEIHFLTRKNFSELFVDHKRLHLIYPDLESTHKGFSGLLRLFRELKVNQYDGMVDLHDVLRSSILRILFRLNGIKTTKINKGRSEKRALTRKQNKVLVPLQTTHERYAQAFQRIGLPIALKIPDHTISNQTSITRIGLAPYAAHKQKMWPLEKSQELISRLLSDSKMEIILFGGGPDETKTLDSWAKSDARIRSTAQLNLGDQIERMKSVDLLVSMDSANMHMASNLGIPVVSIWGATHPYAGFLGYGQTLSNCVQRDDLSCRPCSVFGNKPCWRGDLACLEVSVDTVIQKIYEVKNSTI